MFVIVTIKLKGASISCNVLKEMSGKKADEQFWLL